MTRHYGRRPAYTEAERPRLKLGPALRLAQITVPATVDEVSQVTTWPMYLNDEIGDCTTAAAGHMIEAWTAYGRGSAAQVTDQDVLTAYEAVSGYRPGHPDTDQGAVMQDVLDYWRKTGVGGHKVLAFAELDLRNTAELKAALYLFGHVYFGLVVPASAESQFDDGQAWDVVSHDGGILGGHAVDIGYRDGAAYKVVTWGDVQDMTPAFLAKYGEEAWVVVSQEWIDANSRNPTGLDTDQLNAQFETLTGKPGPFPAGPTPPTPTPPAPPEPPAPTPPGLVAILIAALQQLMTQVVTWIQNLIKSLGG